MATVIAKIGDFDHRVTITIHILRRFRIRMWLALQLFRFAAWVLKANIDVETEPEDG